MSRLLLDWRLTGGYTYIIAQVPPQWWEARLDTLSISAGRGRLFCSFEVRDWGGHTLIKGGDEGTGALGYYNTSYGARRAAERYLIRAGLMTRDGAACRGAIAAFVKARQSCGAGKR